MWKEESSSPLSQLNFLMKSRAYFLNSGRELWLT